MVAAFVETGPTNSRLYVAQQGVIISNLLNTPEFSWLHSIVSALEKVL